MTTVVFKIMEYVLNQLIVYNLALFNESIDKAGISISWQKASIISQ
jgi:hypothetical protein